MSLLSVKSSSHLSRSMHYNMLFQATCASWGSNKSFWKGILFFPPGEKKYCSKHPARDAEEKLRDRFCGKAHSCYSGLCASGLNDRAFYLCLLLPLHLWPGAVGPVQDVSIRPSRGSGVRNYCCPWKATPWEWQDPDKLPNTAFE